MKKEEIEKLREDWRMPTFVAQHQPKGVERILNGICDFSQVKYGDVKKGEGDIVIINCKIKDELKEHINLKDYLTHYLLIEHIEEKGIFTNIYYSKEFFAESIKNIIGQKYYIEKYE